MHTEFTKEQQKKIDRLYRKEKWSIKAIARYLKVGDKRVSAYLRGEKMGCVGTGKKPVKAKPSAAMLIYSPVELRIWDKGGKKRQKVIRGALIPKQTVDGIVNLIDKTNARGLRGRDAILLMALKNASVNLGKK